MSGVRRAVAYVCPVCSAIEAESDLSPMDPWPDCDDGGEHPEEQMWEYAVRLRANGPVEQRQRCGGTMVLAERGPGDPRPLYCSGCPDCRPEWFSGLLPATYSLASQREGVLRGEVERMRATLHRIAALSDAFPPDPKLDNKPWKILGLIHGEARAAIEPVRNAPPPHLDDGEAKP